MNEWVKVIGLSVNLASSMVLFWIIVKTMFSPTGKLIILYGHEMWFELPLLAFGILFLLKLCAKELE